MTKPLKLNMGLFLTLVISLSLIVICSITIIVLQIIQQKTGFTSNNLTLASPCSSYLIQKYNNYYKYILSVQNIGVLIALVFSIFVTIYIIKHEWSRIRQVTCCNSDSQNNTELKKQNNEQGEIINSKQQTVLKQQPKQQNCLQNKSKLCLVYIFNSLYLISTGVSFGLYLSNWFDWKTCTSIDFLVYIYFGLSGLMLISTIIIQVIILIKIGELNNQEIESQGIISKQKASAINKTKQNKQNNEELSQMVNQTNRSLLKPIPVPVEQLNNKQSLVQKLEMQQIKQKNIDSRSQISNQNTVNKHSNVQSQVRVSNIKNVTNITNENINNSTNQLNNRVIQQDRTVGVQNTNLNQNIKANTNQNFKQINENRQNVQIKNKKQINQIVQITTIHNSIVRNITNVQPTENLNSNNVKIQQQNKPINIQIQNQPISNKITQKQHQNIIQPQLRFSYDVQGKITQSKTLKQNLLNKTDNIYASYPDQYKIANSGFQKQKSLGNNLFYPQKVSNFDKSESISYSGNISNNQMKINSQNSIYKFSQRQNKCLKLTSSIYSINQIMQANSKKINNSQGVVDIIPFTHERQKIKKQGELQNKHQQIRKDNIHEKYKRLEQSQGQRYETNRLQHKFNQNNYEDQIIKDKVNLTSPFKNYLNYMENKQDQFQSSFQQSQSSRYHTIRKLVKNSQIQQQRYDSNRNQEQRFNNSFNLNNNKFNDNSPYNNRKFTDGSPFAKIKPSHFKQSLQSHKHKINDSFQDQIDHKVIQNAKQYLKANNYASVLGKKSKIVQSQSNHKNLYRKYNSQQQDRKNLLLNQKRQNSQNQKRQNSQKTYQLTIKPLISPQQRVSDLSYSSFPLIARTPGSKKNIFSSKEKRELLQILKKQNTQRQIKS